MHLIYYEGYHMNSANHTNRNNTSVLSLQGLFDLLSDISAAGDLK